MTPPSLLVVACALLGSMSCDLPKDPRDTLERVQGGELRVGVTEQPPWTERTGPRAEGVEPELVSEFAEELGAKVHWVWGSEQHLFTSLEHYELDLVVGGLTDETPWKTKVGLTKPYLERRVMAVAPGENGFLRRLERFLQARRGAIRSDRAQAP